MKRSWPSRVPGLEYYPEFLSEKELDSLDAEIELRPNAWRQLLDRTVQNHGGLPHAKGMLSTGLPSYLETVAKRLVSAGVFAADVKPNHVLINRYQTGQGIFPHTDGPIYVNVAAIVSLRAPVLFELHLDRECVASLWAVPGSLIVLRGEAYERFHHGISARAEDLIDHSAILNWEQAPKDGVTIHRVERVSLTFRRAAKTLANPIRLSRTRK